MDRQQAASDLELIGRVLDQTRRRVDPQMFHGVIWGAIVLVWYPLMNWFESTGNGRGQLVSSIVAIGTGSLLSAWLGWRNGRRPRLPASNAHLARQLGGLTAVFIGTGILLSIALPSVVRGGERFIPHVWGLLYALMLMAFGVLYSREFFYCGLPSLVAVLAALQWPDRAGYILGPAMGLGCIGAGLIAERRVARLRRTTMDIGGGKGGESGGEAGVDRGNEEV